MGITDGAGTAPTGADVVLTGDDVMVTTDDLVVLETTPVSVAEIVARPEGVIVPDGCVRVTPDDVALLLVRWRGTRTSFAVVDERGRHAGTLRAGRLDLTRAAALDARWVAATLHRTGYVHLDAGNVPRASKARVIARALAVLAELRAENGRPAYVLVEDAQDVLRHPGVPPRGVRLGGGEYHLVLH